MISRQMSSWFQRTRGSPRAPREPEALAPPGAFHINPRPMLLDRAAAWLGRRGEAFWLLALVALGAAVYLPRLAAAPLWDPIETQLTQAAWEMQERNSWLVP